MRRSYRITDRHSMARLKCAVVSFGSATSSAPVKWNSGCCTLTQLEVCRTWVYLQCPANCTPRLRAMFETIKILMPCTHIAYDSEIARSSALINRFCCVSGHSLSGTCVGSTNQRAVVILACTTAQSSRALLCAGAVHSAALLGERRPAVRRLLHAGHRVPRAHGPLHRCTVCCDAVLVHSLSA